MKLFTSAAMPISISCCDREDGETVKPNGMSAVAVSLPLRSSCYDLQQWRIQDFPQGRAPTPKIAIIFQIFAENCMKMKEFGPPGGRASLTPLPWIRQCTVLNK